jgi:hypothetical protein
MPARTHLNGLSERRLPKLLSGQIVVGGELQATGWFQRRLL